MLPIRIRPVFFTSTSKSAANVYSLTDASGDVKTGVLV
jgi:hypothetical protein